MSEFYIEMCDGNKYRMDDEKWSFWERNRVALFSNFVFSVGSLRTEKTRYNLSIGEFIDKLKSFENVPLVDFFSLSIIYPKLQRPENY